ncbi:MAG TPA: pyruvate dehydrogenase (acetyl-transferring), homodimeric type, partial [Verrucomicrobiae bacterium]|nr:pyruvate dehydrogenase (acetyl-transferring), homodimeric type [Verrucomicrobiae bacterium]
MSDKLKAQKRDAAEEQPSLTVLPVPNGESDDRLLESLGSVVEHTLKSQAHSARSRFLGDLAERLREQGAESPRVVSTPYLNTIPPEKQAPFPGDW